MRYPILIFAYNRPDYLEKTLNALCTCNNADRHELFLFLDAPNKKRKKDVELCKEVYEIAYDVQQSTRFKSVHIIKSQEHKGCRANVKEGLDYIFEKYDGAIDVEDDICVASDFLDFMDEALELYRDDERIFSITGYTPPIIKDEELDHDMILLKRFSSWGFGIWKDRWEKVDYDIMYHKSGVNVENISIYPFSCC